MSNNLKVAALLAGQISLDGDWSATDFAELALAAADQAGASLADQRAIAALLPSPTIPSEALAVANDAAAGIRFEQRLASNMRTHLHRWVCDTCRGKGIWLEQPEIARKNGATHAQWHAEEGAVVS